ncbi:DUF1931 family protein [Microbispora sp. GKU 823]|uniref:DUF1931 family protein n=1 Tax=Microbispora sp. GKU 823 TaxID=1652100 RepID=UPI0035616977
MTKGLQESIHRFRDLDEDIELKPILEQLAALPPLDLSIGEEVRERLPETSAGWRWRWRARSPSSIPA